MLFLQVCMHIRPIGYIVLICSHTTWPLIANVTSSSVSIIWSGTRRWSVASSRMGLLPVSRMSEYLSTVFKHLQIFVTSCSFGFACDAAQKTLLLEEKLLVAVSTLRFGSVSPAPAPTSSNGSTVTYWIICATTTYWIICATINGNFARKYFWQHTLFFRT